MRKTLLTFLFLPCLALGGLRTGSQLGRGGGLSHFQSVTVTPPITLLTNPQKLSLTPNMPIGSVVHVSDGFVVSGLTASAGQPNGFYVYNSGAGEYERNDAGVLFSVVNNFPWQVNSSVDGDLADANGDGSEEFPWNAVWTGGVTLTHPAVQTLAAPSSAQGGVAVTGGTQDGVYTFRGTNEGKQYGALLGSTSNSTASAVSWLSAFDPGSGEIAAWFVFDSGGTALYYSTSAVATPDLATNWKNASDDSAASITVTSVSVGEINAGLFVTNDGDTNGSSYVSQPFHGRQYYMGLNGGGSNNMHWDTDYNVWTDDVGVWTTQNVAFPWQGTDAHTGHNGATFSRNNVANEANWTTP